MFGETPTPGHITQETPNRFGETPTPKRSTTRGGSRWDDKTPLVAGGMSTLAGISPSIMQTPSSLMNLTPERIQMLRVEKEIDERNRPFADEELDQLLPGQAEGYEVI